MLDGRPVQVQRLPLAGLESCIEGWKANPADDLRITRVTGVSERTLELATRKSHGVTLPSVARTGATELSLPRPVSGEDHIGDGRMPALRVTLMGRFALDYRAVFCELPRETLVRV